MRRRLPGKALFFATGLIEIASEQDYISVTRYENSQGIAIVATARQTSLISKAPRGRPPIGTRAMSDAERARRYRAARKKAIQTAQNESKGLAQLRDALREIPFHTAEIERWRLLVQQLQDELAREQRQFEHSKARLAALQAELLRVSPT